MNISLDDKGPLGEFAHTLSGWSAVRVFGGSAPNREVHGWPREFIEIHSSRPFALTEFWVTLRGRTPARNETLRIESAHELELEVSILQLAKRRLWRASLFFPAREPVRIFLRNVVEHELEVGGHWEAIEP